MENGNIKNGNEVWAGKPELDEESEGFIDFLRAVGKEAGENAIRVARVLQIPITSLVGNQVVTKYPDGRIEVISEIPERMPSPFKKGVVYYAKK
ncbi:MAG: hypothetical protein V4543_01905 [Bacteroidota bacterium]